MDVEQHKIDYKSFIYHHQDIIYMLVSIMKEYAFPFLQKYMAGTVLSLERFLKNLYMLPENMINLLQDFFQKNKTTIMSEKGVRLWEEILYKQKTSIYRNMKRYTNFRSTDDQFKQL